MGEIVNYISNKISREPLHIASYPVGLKSQVKQVKWLLDRGSDDGVHMVGIYGIGGMGKSTLSRAIYNFVADQFDGLCFLHDVRENSAKKNLKHLQEKLLLKITGSKIKIDHVSEGIPIIKERLSRKKILLILDDVDNMKQLHALAGGLDWFGRGSRVIITTQDKQLLRSHGIKTIYAVEKLNGTEALELLRWVLFKSDKVPSCYEDILNRAVAYASGLPLVIEIVGSNLFGKNIEEWKNTLDGYEKIPNKEIQKILKVSYDALEEEEQSVFLDIACCLKGCEWEDAKHTLESHYGHSITHHLGVLAAKSLIDQYYGHVTLHDLIEDMGKEVVRQESPKEPGERSRLWCQDDIVHVLKENTGTSKIEIIYVNSPSMVIDWNGKAFKKMKKLKTLIIENGNFSKGLKYLPRSLRVLKWKGCSSESLSYCISNKEFNYMKVLTLNNCQYLTHIPDVSGLSNLENFSFQNCHSLITIHNSVGCLNKLEILDARDCIKLESFPPLRLPSLKEFKLDFCSSFKSFPDLLCEMTNLKSNSLYYTSLGELPFSFQNHIELHDLTIERGGTLRFPDHNDKMNSVVLSNVDNHSFLYTDLSNECFPIVLKWFVNMKRLDLQGNNFKILPECISECHLLRTLNLDRCESLEEIRGIPPNLKKFSFPNGREGIPDWFEHQIKGDTISFWFRKKIPSITSIMIPPIYIKFEAFNLFVNGYRRALPEFKSGFLLDEHAFLFQLKSLIRGKLLKSEIDEALSKDEWILVELNWKKHVFYPTDDTQMGIHLWKEKNNTEEDVTFTNPHSALVSDMQNLVLTETKEKEHHG